MSAHSIQLDPPDFAAIGRSCFCLQSRMAARALTRYYNEVLAPTSLEVTEFSLLASVALGRDKSITDLADRLAFERTTLVRSLKRLERRGLVDVAPEKGRAVRYILTKRGEEAVERAAPIWWCAQKEIEDALTSEPHDAARALRSIVTAARVVQDQP